MSDGNGNNNGRRRPPQKKDNRSAPAADDNNSGAAPAADSSSSVQMTAADIAAQEAQRKRFEEAEARRQQQKQQQQQERRPRNHQLPLVVVPKAVAPEHGVECTLCSDPVEAFGVFDCGHFACHRCALRIRRSFRSDPHQRQHGNNNNNNGNGGAAAVSQEDIINATKGPCKCHVCRAVIVNLVITEMAPANPDSLQYDKNELKLLSPQQRMQCAGVQHMKKFLPLNCYVTSDACAMKLTALIAYVCPHADCWTRDEETGARAQEPFSNLDGLQKHLRVDHGGHRFCDVCVMQGFSFLNELPVYTPAELALHMRGACTTPGKDLAAFNGHPSCLFCNGKTLYDGDAMLEHLKLVHYVCDFCNMGSYKFCYYNDREALNRHWAAEHKLCAHADCAHLDASERVFASELDLSRHMSTRHGVKTKVSLTEFGFNSNANDVMLPPRGGGGAAAAAAHAAVTEEQRVASQAANLQTTLITFDFVGRRQVVPLVPKAAAASTPASPASTSGATTGGRRGRGRGQQQDGAGASSRPSEFERFGRENDDGGGASADTEPASGAAPAATSTTTTAGDAEEADGLLRRIVHEKLKKDQTREFQAATVAFLKEQIKAVEFFTRLQRLFPDEEVLTQVHACLVTTLRAKKNDLAPALAVNASARESTDALIDGLVAAKALILTAEAQRVKEAAAEDDRKRKQADVRRQHQAAMKGGSSGYGGSSSGGVNKRPVQIASTGGAGSGNVWSQRATEQRVVEELGIVGGGASSARQAVEAQRAAQAASWGGGARNSGGGAAAASASPWNSQPASPATGSNANKGGFSSSQPQAPVRSGAAAAAAVSSAPSLEELTFPGLQTTTRKGNPHPNQPPKPKGVWKNNKLLDQ